MISNILSSWKEISAYTGFTERTLQRWEQRFGFPVHRPAGKVRSSVSALVTEIEAWLSAAPSIPEIRQTFARYPAKLLHHSSQEAVETALGSTTTAAAPAGACYPGQLQQRPALGPDVYRGESRELTHLLLSEVCLMKLLCREQASRLAELATLRARLARTRKNSEQARRNSKIVHSPFCSGVS